jgi:hypothetical protein
MNLDGLGGGHEGAAIGSRFWCSWESPTHRSVRFPVPSRALRKPHSACTPLSTAVTLHIFPHSVLSTVLACISLRLLVFGSTTLLIVLWLLLPSKPFFTELVWGRCSSSTLPFKIWPYQADRAAKQHLMHEVCMKPSTKGEIRRVST